MVDERLARYYDLDFVDEHGDLDLYLALAESVDGPVLELAAGTGRIALPLATAGHDVTAVDSDPEMMRRARRRWDALPAIEGAGSIDFVEADITELQLDRRFGLAILALNTLLLLPDRQAQLAALRALARHLAPDGRAVIDVWLPTPDDLALYDGRLVLDWSRVDEETGEQVAKSTSGDYDPASAVARVTTFFDAWTPPAGELTRTTRTDHFSLLSATEVLGLIDAAGLRPAVMGGDYALTAFGTGSERIVVVCALL